MIDKNITQIKNLEARIKEQDEKIAELEKRIEVIGSFRQQDEDNLYIVTETVKQIPNTAAATMERLSSTAFEAHCNRMKEIEGRETDGIMESFLDDDPAEMELVYRNEDEEIYS